jgi:hypothetical protein
MVKEVLIHMAIREKKARIWERSISVGLTTLLILASTFVVIPWTSQRVQALTLDHDNANVQFQSADNGRMYNLFWNGVRQSAHDGSSDYMGLVIDHDPDGFGVGGYDHTIADLDGVFISDFYDDDFDPVPPGIYWEENTPPAKLQSLASYNHTTYDLFDPNPPRSDIYDVDIEQRTWTLQNKNWAVSEFKIINTNDAPLYNVYVGFYIASSYNAPGPGTFGGVDGDGGDESASWDAPTSTLRITDDSGVSMALSSAGIPLDHYFASNDDGAYWAPNWAGADDADLYDMTNQPNAVGGGNQDKFSIVGWNLGDLPVGMMFVLPLIIAFNDTAGAVMNDVQEANNFYYMETLPVYITEFTDEPLLGNQRIEVYNGWGGNLDITGWYFQTPGYPSLNGNWFDSGGSPLIPLAIPAFDYAYFEVDPSTALATEGDRITLFDVSDFFIDEVAYGYMGPTPGFDGLYAPDPIAGQSGARVWQAATSSYIEEWGMVLPPNLPTFGTDNNIPAMDRNPDVVLNEVSLNPSPACGGFIELRYVWDAGTISLIDFHIVVDDDYVIPSGSVSPSNRFYLLDEANYPAQFDLDNGVANGDNVYIFDNAGRLLDMVGWDLPHGQDSSVARVPEGDGTHDGYNDTTSILAKWVFESTPTYTSDIAIEADQSGGGDIGRDISYPLMVYNFNPTTSDTVELNYTSTSGVILTFYDGTWNAITSVSLSPSTNQQIFANVSIPLNPTFDFELTIVNASSTSTGGNCPAGYDTVRLNSRVYPYLRVTKTATPDPIWVNGAGLLPDTTTVTVTIEGKGAPRVGKMNQDVVFMIDSSGSMLWNDQSYLRLQAVKG